MTRHPNELAFIEHILAEPAEDLPRLVFADYLDELGDPRGEFIRVQCALAKLTEDDPQWFVLKQREERLLKTHESAWTDELTGFGGIVRFHRGLPEGLTIDARRLATISPELPSFRTIRWLEITGASVGLVDLARRPHLAQIERLDLYGVSELRPLWDSPHLGRLRQLGLLHSCLSDEAVRIFANSRSLQSLEALSLVGGELSPKALGYLAERNALKSLRSLNLSQVRLDSLGAIILAQGSGLGMLDRLELRRCHIGDGGLLALLAQPHLARALCASGELDLCENLLSDDSVTQLADCPETASLRWLDLSNNEIRSAGIARLARSRYLRNLTRLNLYHNRIACDGATVLARSRLFGQLKFCDVSYNRIGERGLRELTTSPYFNWRNTILIDPNSAYDSDPSVPIEIDYLDEDDPPFETELDMP